MAPDAHFTDLGGDSLSALTFGNLLHEIFDVDVPVGVIVSPANDLAAIADYIEAERQGGPSGPRSPRCTAATRPRCTPRDLTLDKFLDEATLAAAPSLPGPSREVRTVLLTGATGFLGRYLALEWLERMDLVDGKVIALVRAKYDDDARARLDATFDSGDPKLLAHYRELAAEHLEVIAGDKGEANLGLDQQTWQRLADTVDLIVDPAALVNHVLPYSQLFGPNALGTAELIRIALTTKIKPYTYVSTIGVGDQIEPGTFVEDADIRQISATRAVDDSYANGYGNSKWAGEVLLREAHDLCGLPVAVFRCDMILADTTYAGQLNLPDMFTRLMLSLVATGIAPGSFYELDATGSRQRAHYDGLPVEFIAEAISTLGAQVGRRVRDLPRDEPVRRRHRPRRVRRLADRRRLPDRSGSPTTPPGWQRFETTLRALPEASASTRCCRCCTTTSGRSKPINGSLAPDRPVPRGGAGGENRAGQRHSACLGADHRQVRHRPAAARPALESTRPADANRPRKPRRSAATGLLASSSVAGAWRVAGGRTAALFLPGACGRGVGRSVWSYLGAELPVLRKQPEVSAAGTGSFAARIPRLAPSGPTSAPRPLRRGRRSARPARRSSDFEHGALGVRRRDRVTDAAEPQRRRQRATDDEPGAGDNGQPAAEHRGGAVPRDQQQKCRPRR